jgi:hypothetical protein
MATTDIYHISGGLKGRKAVAFLGGAVDDGVQIDTFAAGRVATNDTVGSFTAWFNVPDKTGTYAILGCGDANAVEYFYFAVVAGQIQVKAALAGPNIAWDIITTGTLLQPHVWHHLAVVQDGQWPKIYVDGVLRSVTLTNVTEGDYWFDEFTLIDGGHIGCADSIAGDAALTLEFKGAISNVKYWNTTLTDAQVVDDYNEVNYTTGLIAHWAFNGDYLESVTAYDGTAVGAIILTSNFSEFTSRFRYDPAAAAVVADKVLFTADGGTGHALIIKAA